MTYTMTFDSYADAVQYFTCLGLTRLPVRGIETWGGSTYDDDGSLIPTIARGSIRPGMAKEWTFFEKRVASNRV